MQEIRKPQPGGPPPERPTQRQPVKFYQTGTFTVGNRLLPENVRSVQADMRRTNSLNSGHRACQGCGEALGARYAIDAAMLATGNQLILSDKSRVCMALSVRVISFFVNSCFNRS